MATPAPRDARWAAIARPMPREAPVTKAACPLRSNMGRCLHRLHAIDGTDVGVGRPSLQHAGQDTARSDLHELADPRACQVLNRLLPAHRSHDLLSEVAANAAGIHQGFARDVAYHGYPWRADC